MSKGQKFYRGQRVKVDDVMPPSMAHFKAGFIGIVDHSYSDAYGLGNDKEYCLLVLDEKGKGIDCVAWYPESQLTLISDDRRKGENLLQDYKQP